MDIKCKKIKATFEDKRRLFIVGLFFEPIKNKIEYLISTFGEKLFLNESDVSSNFIEKLRDIRVSIFHASFKLAHNLNAEDQVRIIMKLSILHRVIFLTYLGVADHHNDENFKYLVYAIDNWPNKQMHIFEWMISKDKN